MTDPLVLNKVIGFGLQNHIHSESSYIEATLRLLPCQPSESRRRQDGNRKYIQERADGKWGVHFERRKQRRAEFLRDHRISVAPGIRSLDVRVVLVDGEIFWCRLPQGDITPEMC